MKTIPLMFTCVALLCSANSFAKTTPLKSPTAGVVCDQYICADKKGVSKTLTTKYLGKKQANKAFSQGEFDTTQFTFANGVFCDTKTQLCHVDRYFEANNQRSAIDPKTTKLLFPKK
ncbi:YcgJ family protein [Acinetobacter rudis]|uniref:YcgJ family protein n=1 Tax=Acinetobacter rudis TaxID=632955 RepID=UPI00280E79DB|nr:YcgJ family protein [Acinetobacter rudis]MDQ8953049.1 YcgJ family protein [Acinetobacter rudis]